MNTLFVFDFDGVLFDTARECLTIAFESARRHADRWSFARRWEDAAVAPTALESRFLRHRHWVGPPWQYAVLLKCIAEGSMPANTPEFLRLASSLRSDYESFTNDYFAMRREIASDLNRWVALVEPFADAVSAFRDLHERGEAVILSTRDDESIRRLCSHYLNIELSSSSMLPRSGPREKWAILLDAATERGLAPPDVFFLDDYLHHALPAHRRGIAAHLAAWGYLGDDDIAAAAAAGLPAVYLSELGGVLREHDTRMKENRL